MTGDPLAPQARSGGRGPGALALIGAAVLAALAVVIVLQPDRGPAPALPTATEPSTLGIAAVEYPTPLPTIPPTPTLPPVEWVRPTADPQTIAAALERPLAVAMADETIARQVDPLTIIPERPRSTVITYTVKKGDNLRDIAARFGLDENTIIWSNDRFYVNAMRVGLELNILPVDGVYHHVQGTQTIAEIAQMYQVDPYAIIDSEFNTLFGAKPETVLPEGLWIIVPGGTGSTEPIYWDPGIVMARTSTDGSNPIGAGISVGADVAAFAIGDPGSCGKQVVSGGSPPVSPPLYARYRITQDFSWNHGGIDLAVPPGTPVFAAGGGTVIFSGMSTWGYGYTVVIAHGSTLSLYGHLNGAFVSCGQTVTAGQNIAVTGNSGRSSGPHLHFEIRGPGGAPVNPWNYQSF
ncbi:MAG: peptidoglycan DD-metalloendopeptidase family protein [Aggregatilineaceae bacterium]